MGYLFLIIKNEIMSNVIVYCNIGSIVSWLGNKQKPN
jgi:hypothetical protein